MAVVDVVMADAREVDMTNAQSWTLLGFVGVLLSVIGALLINQFHLLRAYIDARFDTVDARFDAVDGRFDSLDRDVQALTTAFFRRE
jgi:hypothetical protein